MTAERDPIAAYLETFERLRARKRWSTDTATYRFVALTLGAAGDRVSHDRLEEVAAGLRKRAGWTSPLRSEIRYVVAAMILRRDLDPAGVHRQVIATRDRFREHGVKRRGTGATLAALLLVLQAEGKRVPKAHLDRLARIYAQWRADHFWLTDGNDLPAAALHAGRELSVESLTGDIQRAYARLRDAGFRRGNQLQLVSHLLAVDPAAPTTRSSASPSSPTACGNPASASGPAATTRLRSSLLPRARPDTSSTACCATATACGARGRGPRRTSPSRSPPASNSPRTARRRASATPATSRRCSPSAPSSTPSRLPPSLRSARPAPVPRGLAPDRRQVGNPD